MGKDYSLVGGGEVILSSCLVILIYWNSPCLNNIIYHNIESKD